ncbi:hypothetical protein RQP46_003982 [Phenoliferia psychrophenolica]
MATTHHASALLAFPNEVLDDILSQLITSIPPDPAHTTSRKSTQLQALETVSLVSKKWRAVALRRLVAKLVVRSGKKARAIVHSLTSGDLGGLVKEIEFGGSVDVVALLSLTTRLNIRRLRQVDFVRFRQRDVATLSTLTFLASVETLDVKPHQFDINLELMATFIPLFTNLRYLRLTIITTPKSPQFTSPPPTHPFLHTLALHLQSPSNLIATLLSLISLPTPGTIKRFELASWAKPLDLDRLMSQVGPGLETLVLRSLEGGVLETLPSYTKLVTLQVFEIWEPDHAILLLSNLPDNVATLRLAHGHIHLLNAMKTTPKPAGLLILEMDTTHEEELQDMVGEFIAYGIEVVFVFSTVNGVDVALDFFLPPGASKDNPAPILVWFHGGGLIQGSRKVIWPHLLSAPAKHSLCVVAPDYRLAPQTRMGGILADVAAAMAYVRSPAFLAATNYSCDQSKIIVSGGSAGGWLALLAGTGIGFEACGIAPPAKPLAIAAIYPISDLEDPFWKTKQHPVSYFPRVIEAKEMQAFLDADGAETSSSSPDSARSSFYTYMVQEGILADLLLGGTGIDPKAFSVAPALASGKFTAPPTFVVHGTIDDKVPLQQAIDVVKVLEAKGVKHEFEFDREESITMDRMYSFIKDVLQ